MSTILALMEQIEKLQRLIERIRRGRPASYEPSPPPALEKVNKNLEDVKPGPDPDPDPDPDPEPKPPLGFKH